MQKRRKRNSRADAGIKASAIYIAAVAATMAAIIYLIFGAPGTSTTAPTTSPNLQNVHIPNIDAAAISSIANSGAYHLVNSTTYYAGSATSNAPIYQSVSIYAYSNYTSKAAFPATITSIVVSTPDNASAMSEVISMLFGDRPNGQTDGYIQNSSNPIENAIHSVLIDGVNITFYNVFASTQGTGLPLYHNISVSPPVFQYTTIFQYGRIAGEVISTSQAPLDNGAYLNLNISEALFKRLYNATQ